MGRLGESSLLADGDRVLQGLTRYYKIRLWWRCPTLWMQREWTMLLPCQWTKDVVATQPLHPPWQWALKGLRMGKHRQWPRELRCRSQDWLRWAHTPHLPTHRQALSSITWDVRFSLINSNLLKGKSRAVSWSRMAVSVSVIHLCDHVADGGLWLPCPASQESAGLHRTSPRKDENPNSKFQVWFSLNTYHFRAIVR